MPTEALRRKLGDRLLRNEPMARYTAARIGGPADWLYVARESTEEMVEVVSEAWTQGISVRVLGGGANVLVSDQGARGLIVINRVSEVKFGSWHGGRAVSATSGTGLTVLSQKCQTNGLAGLEWAVSVPGTVGGAIVNNAGAHGGDVSCCLGDAVVLEEDGPKLYTNEEMQYDYRHSMLKARTDRQYLVLLATFIVFRDDPDAIKDRMSRFVDYRKRSQPPGASLGSIFKNPPGDYAGRLIENAGLKGHRIGSVMVSPIHANFFINDIDSMGPAAASDYHALVCHVCEVVFAESGIKLEPEIEFVGQWDG